MRDMILKKGSGVKVVVTKVNNDLTFFIMSIAITDSFITGECLLV